MHRTGLNRWQKSRSSSRHCRPVDWIGFGYVAAIALGGFMGYKRKGSVMSLMAGLVFSGLSAYGACNISNDSKVIV